MINWSLKIKLCIGCLVLMGLCGCQSKFDKEIWRVNQNSNHDNPRFNMVEDLRNNFLRKDMSREEVITLLGLPMDDTVESPYEYRYEIGSNPGLHMDRYFLEIEFDSAGHLVDSRVEEH